MTASNDTAKLVRGYVQPVLTALLIAALLWVANTTNTNNTALAVMSTKIEHLTAEIAKVRSSVNDRVSMDAFVALAAKVSELNDELTGLHRRLSRFRAREPRQPGEPGG